MGRRWWHLAWGRESFSNARYTCCDQTRLRSKYDTPSLHRAVHGVATTAGGAEAARGARLAWFGGHESREAAVNQ